VVNSCIKKGKLIPPIFSDYTTPCNDQSEVQKHHRCAFKGDISNKGCQLGQ